MVGESFHPRGCWGEDSDHIRLGATAQKPSRLFAFRRGAGGESQNRLANSSRALLVLNSSNHRLRLLATVSLSGKVSLDFCGLVGYLLPAK
jgi:hypothetical protein